MGDVAVEHDKGADVCVCDCRQAGRERERES